MYSSRPPVLSLGPILPGINLHAVLELPEVLVAAVVSANGELGADRHKVGVDFALLVAAVLEVLGTSGRGSSGTTVAVEDELLGKLGDSARADNDLLTTLILFAVVSSPLSTVVPTASSSSLR